MMEEKRIALLIETSTSWGTNIVKGIADYAHSHANWYFHLEPRGKYERLSLPKKWNGDGIIARVTYEELANQIIESGKPAVNVSWFLFGQDKIPSCTTDQNLAGRMIAHHFMERGFRRFAYCGPMNRPSYTDMFGQAFVAAVDETGYGCHLFEEKGVVDNPMDWNTRRASLAKWIVTLPTPIAMLAFNDAGGRQIAEACRMCGLHIPDQIALMGGEHDELTCQITRPPLSSIDLSPQRIGWEAAALLARLLDGETLTETAIRIPPARIIARQSTDNLAIDDEMIVRSLKFIVTNVSDAITVADVLDSVPISRRVLEQRFKKYLGRSPAAEIRRVRVEKSKRLLADTDHSIADIASKCGFEHPEVLTRVFRRQEGITPSAYRKFIRASD
jgi:LacI family transcriptional regulator, galactose operon repressor